MGSYDIDLVLKIQEILRRPFFDYLFYAISFLGSEYFFLIITLVLYLCVSKRFAYKFFNVFMLGQLFVGITKTLVKKPRPFERGAAAVLEKTSGYSFPSGHSYTIANISCQFVQLAKEKTAKNNYKLAVLVGAILTFLVMFSRIYLGQHYLTDVLVGGIFGVLAAVLFGFLFDLLKDKEQNLAFAIVPLSIVALIVCLILDKNPEGVTRLIGAYAAMSIGYYLEKKHINYNVKSGGILKQITKIIIGVVLIVFIRQMFSAAVQLLELSSRPDIIISFICYYVIGFLVSFVLPLFFMRIKL